MIIRWCTAEPQCGGNMCHRAFEQRGQQTAGMTVKADEGRRPDDVIRLFIRELGMVAVTDGNGVQRHSPDTAEYEVHTVYDQDGGRYWVALYAGEQPLVELLATSPPYDQERAITETARLLAAHDEERAAVKKMERRRW